MMTRTIGGLALFLLLLCNFGQTASAEEPEFIDVEALTLQDLLNMETSVTTKSAARTLRETPGIISVISREELTRLGVRDLLDVMQLVPGFDVGVDTFGELFMGARGIWTAEGKVLVLFDGHPAHDLGYGMVPLGNHFPMDWIERVEIVRGPGSVVRGGVASSSSSLAPRRTAVRLRRSVFGSLHLGRFRTGTQKMSFGKDGVFR